MACVKGEPSSHRACVERLGRLETMRAKPWRQRWSGWYRIPDASGQIRAATIADGSPSRGRWATAPAGKPPAVVVARWCYLMCAGRRNGARTDGFLAVCAGPTALGPFICSGNRQIHNSMPQHGRLGDRR